MSNKKMRKIFSVILPLFFVMIFISGTVFAKGVAGNDNFSLSSFNNDNGNKTVNKATKTLMGTGIEVVRIVGVGISIIMLSYIGVKYMMAAPAEKADFKKSAYIYVLGAVLIFAASNILNFVAKFALEINE